MKDIDKNTNNKPKQKEQDEVKSFEYNGIKDYKFTIILLSVIVVAAFSMPFIYKGVRKLSESNFISDLFSKNDTSDPNPIDNNDKKDDNVVTNSDQSGASEPVLKEGMIPVRYNYIENKWVKADASNPSTNNWYNYNNSEWANAILVRENGTKTRKYYEKAKPDTVINNEDILAFYTWIPRYKYSLVSSTGVQQIDVVFENKTAKKTTGPNYITHPAFTFDGEELSGVWVGKFEVTGNPYNITILPNQTAFVNVNIATMINSIQVFYGNAYGLNKEDSTLRLMKNTEWGAVVYLTNSKYGICKKNKCSTMATYNFDYSSELGFTTSTTGNITGVYAMNGGVMEYVMGNNNNVLGESGVDSVWMNANKQYYDLYKDGTNNDFTRGISGDATTEFGPFTGNTSSWANANATFVDINQPWFLRDIGNNIYSFGSYTGGAHYQVGFRLSLS